MQGVACRVVGVRLREFARALRPAAVLAIGVALGAALGGFGVPGDPAVRLTLATVLGAGLGLGAVWLADREFVRDTVRMVLARRPAHEPSVA
jgi:hypothetical protein